MAAIAPTITDISEKADNSVLKVVWNRLDATNNVGVAIRFSQWADRSVQMNGTFNAANVVFEGSNNGGGTYFTLTDPQGNAILKAAAAGEAITELTEYARPNSSGGGAGQDVEVSLIMRRANPFRT